MKSSSSPPYRVKFGSNFQPFVRKRDVSPYAWHMEADARNELRIMTVGSGETGPARTLVRKDLDQYIRPVAGTPDHRELVVLQWLDRNAVQLGLVSTRDGSYRSIKSLDWRSPLSPDGRYIAYDALAADASSPRDIFILAMDGSQEAAAVADPANDWHPLWSPDGTRLVFLSNRGGANGLWSVDVQPGRPIAAPVLVKRMLAACVP